MKTKKAGKKIMIIVAGVIALLVLLFLIWAVLSSGKIRTYDGEKSLSEKFVMDVNGAPNGFFINSKNTDNPILLFVSSGPGTDDYVFTDKYKDMNIEDDYTIVYWDYRDMGIAYDPDYDTDQITLENILQDTHDVTQYLKERFGKEKIYIMGFSGGTHIALRAAQKYSEDYIALINMAQCVTDGEERDILIYQFMKDVFTKRNDRRALQKLEAATEQTEDGKVRCKNWYDFVYLLHDAGGGTILNKTEFEGIVLPILFCRCYTMKEKLQYVPAMKMYRTTPLQAELEGFDYRKEIEELKIPAYFISGAYDYNCPWELVQEYEENLKAPDKGFYRIENAAHSPLWENAKETCAVMKQIKEKTNE